MICARKLRENTTWFRERMTGLGFDVLPGDHPIVPVMLGDAGLASRMADLLLQRGVYVIGFSYPVVPIGKARIRVQLSAAHTRDDLERASGGLRRGSGRAGLRGEAMYEPTGATTPSRHAERVSYDAASVHQILDEAVGLPRRLCRRRPPSGAPDAFCPRRFHVCSSTPRQALTWRGSLARKGGLEVAVEVSIVDALVLARSAFNHSANYRAVVAHGTATLVQGAEREGGDPRVPDGEGRAGSQRQMSARRRRRSYARPPSWRCRLPRSRPRSGPVHRATRPRT